MLRVTSAYRTVASDALNILSGIPPIDLQAMERMQYYKAGKEGRNTTEARETSKRELQAKWQDRWHTKGKGEWTKTIIPETHNWLNRNHGEVNYYVTQALTGHGCFASYLHKYKKLESPDCWFCGQKNDNAHHTLFICDAFESSRRKLKYQIDADDINEGNLIELMVKSEDGWTAIENFMVNVMKKKEAEERRRQSMPILVFDEIELRNNVNQYIKRMEMSEWSYNFNRIFISPGNSFNIKYFIKVFKHKFLSSKLAKNNQASKAHDLLSNSNKENYQLISQNWQSNIIESQQSDIINELNVDKNDEFIVDDIIDRLTGIEFLRLLNIEPRKRLEAIMYNYSVFNKTLENDVSFKKLDKLSNCDIKTEVPYEIYIEAVDDESLKMKNEVVSIVNSSDLLGLLKTCGIIVIDISSNIAELSKGKEIFRSLKNEIVNLKGTYNVSRNIQLIVVISTVMTWAGVNKKHYMSELDVNNRVPNPKYMEHYEFELEVLSVNGTKGLKEIVKTIIVWAGLTYGYEQDLLQFAFDSACKTADLFPIPNSQNHLPVIHVEDLARLIHKVISEDQKLEYHYIFAVESPINTLKQIITALAKSCDIAFPVVVSLNTFMKKYELKGIHKQIITADIKVNSSINRLWPNFEWYNNKSSILNSMKYLVETYKRAHNIKSIKLIVLGPPASGKTKLALQIAQYYGLIHLEPKKITQDCINGIREEINSLYQKSQLTEDSEDLLDDADDQPEISPIITNKISELNKKLSILYSSMDANNDILEDIYLIPLLNERIALFKRGYVLDGYPTTVDQAKMLFRFDDKNLLQSNIDINKLPDLTVNLKQNAVGVTLSDEQTSDIHINTNTNKNEKRRLLFSEIDTIHSSNSDVAISSSVVNAAKPILKKQIKEKPKHLFWNEQNHNNLLKLLNFYYVPIKMIESPYLPLKMYTNKIQLPEIDPSFKQFLSIIVKEIKMNQQHGILETITDLNKTNSIIEGINIDHQKYEQKQLREKLTLLEDFRKVTDFEYIESLSNEEYLMKYVTPILTKLIVQVAKVRPKNPVDFLAYMALKENQEGLPNLPGYSKRGVNISKILDRMFYLYNYDENDILKTKSLMDPLTTHYTDEED
ncbi:hypothetical protein QTP88_023306 [Uroleucon formosanum]